MKSIPFLLLLILVTSCFNDSDCLITATTEVKIRFKNANGTDRTVDFSSITVSGLSNPFYVDTPASLISLPVNPTSNQVTFTFYHDEVSETLVVTYENEIRVVSKSCGAYQFQKNVSVSESDFSQVSVINSRLLTDVSVNLEAYF